MVTVEVSLALMGGMVVGGIIGLLLLDKFMEWDDRRWLRSIEKRNRKFEAEMGRDDDC